MRFKPRYIGHKGKIHKPTCPTHKLLPASQHKTPRTHPFPAYLPPLHAILLTPSPNTAHWGYKHREFRAERSSVSKRHRKIQARAHLAERRKGPWK